ncbi:hypothetical protein Tco_0693499 [Tanacetum coccineum]
MEILRLTKWVKRLERQRTSSTSQPIRRKYRQAESSDDVLDEEDASKQGREASNNDRAKYINMLLEKYSTDLQVIIGEDADLAKLEAEEESTMANF